MRRRFFISLLLGTFCFTLTNASLYAQVSCSDATRAASQADEAWFNEDYEQALTWYGCLVELEPDNADALFRRAYSAYEMGDSLQAEKDYISYLALNPQGSSALNNLGIIFANRNEVEEARNYYLQAIDADQSNGTAYYNLGLSYYEEGNYIAALEYYQQGLDAEFGNAVLHLGMAWAWKAVEDERQLESIGNYLSYTETRSESIQAPQSLEFSRGMAYTLNITLQAGQSLKSALFTEATSNFDALLLLKNARGQVVAWDDDSGVNVSAVMEFTAQEAGEYTLIATHSNGTHIGIANLSVEIDGVALGTPNDENDALAFSSYDLSVDEMAVVFTTDGDRLNVRSGAGTEFDIISKLPADTLVRLIEGPRKRGGYSWWRIRTPDGVEGWSVERVQTEQTLQPALQVGLVVLAAPVNDTLNVRAEAGLNGAIVTELARGAEVTVLEGPLSVDRMSWWRVRTADGLEGWAVERVDNIRTLIAP